MAYKFQLGPAVMSGSLTQEGGFTLKDDDGSIKFSIDRDLGDISGSGLATLADIHSNASIAATGSITAGTSFIIGSADLNEVDMEKLDGITNGTVAANKAVVVDANKDASGFRNVSLVDLDGSGDLTMGTITMTGFRVDADGDTVVKTLSGSGAVYAAGSVSTSGDFAASGSMSSAGATITGTSALAVVTATSFSGSSTLEAVGAAKFGSSLEVSGTVKLAGVSDEAVAVASDSFYFKDADGLVKSDSIADLATAFAGNGLAASSGVLAVGVDDSSIEINTDALRIKASGVVDAMLNDDVAAGLAGNGLSAASGVMALDLNELTAAAVAVANDSIAIIDADDNSSKKESIADLVTAMAGAGLTATNGVLSTDAGAVSSFGDEDATLVEGMNFGSANLTANRALTLPDAPSAGDIVRVKAPASLGGAVLTIQKNGGTSHLIDGQASVSIESDGAAIACMFVGSNTWLIF
jgi:hypothetical protein